MAFADFAKRAEKLLSDRSPAILTAIGVTGTLTAVYLTGKATFKAAEILGNAEMARSIEGATEDWVNDQTEPLDLKEKAELVWKLYIPAATTVVMTIACIIAANRIGTRQTAAMAAAYSTAERLAKEYKAKVVETVGAKKEQKINDDLNQDRVNRYPVDRQTLIIAGGGDTRCFDVASKRLFTSDLETIRSVVNDLNAQMINDYYLTLNDFYQAVGLEPVLLGEKAGWNTGKLIELKYSAVLMDDGVPCLAIEFATEPVGDFDKYF